MKLSLRLIACLVVSISLVTFVVARSQVRSEKLGLRTDLARRAEILTESLQENVEPVLQQGDRRQLQKIVERFGDREHLAGVAVYDGDAKLLAASAQLGPHAQFPPNVFTESKNNDKGAGGFAQVGDATMYVYALPMHHFADVIGVLVTFHDATYIEAQSSAIWRDAIWHDAAQVLLIVLITYVMMRWSVMGPIARMSQWMKDLRTGKAGPIPEASGSDLLGDLTSEATQLAQHLNEARMSAKEEARLREAGDSQWTPERLRVGVRRKLRGNTLFVVSNREPYMHVHRGKGIEVQVPASGLVTALEPILVACEGTWIAHGSADADRETVDANDRLRVPPENPHYTLRRVWLTKEEEEGYYYGFSNEGIWPLCHIAHTRPTFRASDWEQYRQVNEKFARAVLQETANAEKPFILIQDYHFALLPRLIKEARPDARVAIFWHIPWPNPEAFGICPWEKELLDGLLGADLVSFHIQAHCNNFLETVDHAIQSRIEWDRFVVNRNNHYTAVRPHPISVAFPDWKKEPGSATKALQNRQAILEGLGSESLFLGVGVDRVDYTKGLVERFRGIERFLEKYPHYVKQFTFAQFGAPSRTNIPRYQHFFEEVEAEAKRINERFQSERWKPIVFFNTHHSHKEIDPYYRAADLCMVTSLHDGMNLVAKEFIAARSDDDGVLILSQFTGASRELHDALLVNPYDVEQLAEAIRRALEMQPEERHARMVRMRQTVKEHNVYRWAAELISELAEIRLDTPETVETR
ncbi:MAG TPA: trehalose-6-phosphate synthase [Candidatus Acidoferrales bacterium]|nr:trehalose-6-phosphate synthase [Candidatus Acidoferrales bacterium]